MCEIIKLCIALYIYLCFIVIQTTTEYDFVDEVLQRFRRQNNDCELPAHPKNGFWKVYDSTTIFAPGMFVSSGKVLVIRCNKRHNLVGSKTLLCTDDGWTEPIGRCLRTCRSRHNTTFMSVTCTFNNVPLPNCKTPFEGTIARFKCADFYEDLSLDRHPVHICTRGRWSHDIPECEPICGQKSVGKPTLIVNGDNVTRGDYPWQTAIYNLTSKILICGGSLINQRIILTAAHCVADDRGKLYSKELYGVSVGKYYRSFNDSRDRDVAQFSLIQDIFIPKQYKGEIQNYVADIAIMITKISFQLSFHVQPVCVDWELKYQDALTNPPKKLYGYVSGWGYTVEYKQPSEVLKHLKVPPVTNEVCQKYIPEDYERFLTDDKLCAGFLDSSTSVCRGDSGGGLVFRYGLRYYVMGIVSNSPQAPTAEGGCDSQQYGFYTKVSHYIRDFLLEKEAQFRPSNIDFVECKDGSYSCTTPTSTSTTSTTTQTPLDQTPKDSCIVPEQPNSGRFSISGFSDSLSSGTSVSSGTMLEITCNKNYQLDGNRFVACSSGNWTLDFGQCLRTCPSLSETETTSVTCTFKNNETSCHNPLHGTIARYKCADFYEDPQFSKKPVRACRDGSWDQKIPECVPICGQKSVKTTPLIVGGQTAVKGNYPWLVQIYRKDGEETRFNCGGNILNQKVILTAAHCVTRYTGDTYPKEDFIVVAGKYFYKYDDPRDVNTQFSTLEEIIVPPTFKGSVNNYFSDIAILITKDLFKFSLNVQPVCVDWVSQFEKEFSNSKLRGHISGWGFTKPGGPSSEELQDLAVPYVPENTCVQGLPEEFQIFLGPDKMCAGYLNKSKSACNGDTGGGIFFKRNDRFYIVGILSLSPSTKGQCDENKYSLYTKVSYFIDFILEKEAQFRPSIPRSEDEACSEDSSNCLKQNKTTNVEIVKKSCVLPSHPTSGKWSIFDSPSSTLLPGTNVALGTILEVKCNVGLKLDGDQFVLCEKKGWSAKLGKCLKICPSLVSTPTTKVSCTYQSRTVENCTEPVEETVAMYECSHYYELPKLLSPSLICKNGVWNQKPIECVPICGQKAVSTQTLIVNGKSVVKGEYPWHVGIFKKQSTDFVNICGGTLISEKVVVTSAICVTNFDGNVEPKNNYQIGVGKYYRKYKDPRDSANTEYATLEAILIPKPFRGALKDYVADVAVIISSKTFTFSSTVQPVCVDWSLNYETRLTKLFKTKSYTGYVPGWGFTEADQNPSDELRELQVPGINYEDCIDSIPDSFQRYVTYDKMCGGYLNKSTSVCRGDSGGGLVFSQDGKYYFTGIVSLSPSSNVGGCDVQQYSLYTKVSIYTSFIAEQAAMYKS